MILKIETIDGCNRYKLIDEIKEINYEYISMKDHETTLNRLVGMTPENGLIESFVDKNGANTGNFVLITICNAGQIKHERYILTNLSVYVLNDKGDTIERVRY